MSTSRDTDHNGKHATEAPVELVQRIVTTYGGSEGKLDDKGERLRLLEGAFGAAQDAMVITDCRLEDNPIVAVNPAFTRITGYEPHEAIGRNCRFLQGSDREQHEVRLLREAVADERALQVTLRNYRKDGTLFWNELRMAPIRDESGIVTHFVGVQNDITGRVLAEQALVRRTADLERTRDDLQDRTVELADATQARDRFMAIISHEMRTPINAVLGYADLLELEMQGPLNSGQHEYVDRIRRTGRSLLDLVNDVLDLTSAEFGQLDVQVDEVDPASVAEEVTELLDATAQQQGLELSLQLADTPLPTVRADRRRLRQVLLNLVSNAIKFTEKGSITLRVSYEGELVRFEVRDTGIGIAADKLPFVFDEFFQADKNLTRRHGGAGLGLAISRRLARLMGGELRVTSQLGSGSTFSLWVPVATRENAAPSTEALASRQSARRFGGTATVSPDEGANATTVVVFGPSRDTVNYLARTLYPDVRLIRADEASHVAQVARDRSASLIVIDVTADGGTAWQAAYALREEHELDDVPLLILPKATPSAAQGTVAALDLGTVAFARKLPEPSSSVGPSLATAASTIDEMGSDAPSDADRLARAVGRAAAGSTNRVAHDGPPNVLVIDDDDDARRITARVLQGVGANVREATSGEAGLADMRAHRPDVAVIDLLMPVLDGFGVLAAMRADPRLRSIPVVVLTTKVLTAAERDYLSRTAERVLEKGEYRLSDVATLILRAAMRR